MTAPEALAPATELHWRTPTLLDTLGPGFYAEVPPSPLPALHWVAHSSTLAEELGLREWLGRPEALDLLGGNALPAGRVPRASVYSGHQFGQWAGQLGDGRALTLGELDTPAGVREIQLKGAGRTPYSRMGDGRAVLRSSIREFLCSEAMQALGIPTTRALALVGSPAQVRRETIETAAVVTRVAPSFLRFGHFEHFAHTRRDVPALQHLVDTVIDTFYPECRTQPHPTAALLSAIGARTAELMADWQAVGFCHGVMNTDNMSVLGLTIDYGPFGFLDGFDPGHICNHTDTQGRYAYARQPQVAYWNLHALAQALAPLFDEDVAPLEAALAPYREQFPAALMRRMRAKLGLRAEREEDGELVDDFLRLLAAGRVDYTIAWRRLSRWQGTSTAQPDALPAGHPNRQVRDLFLDRAAFDAWAQRYDQRLQAEASVEAERQQAMQRVNPKYILRNHLAEQAIRRAETGNFSEVQRLLDVLSRPFDEQEAAEADAGFPPDWAAHLEISCSS